MQSKLQPHVDVTFLVEVGTIERQVRAAPGNVSGRGGCDTDSSLREKLNKSNYGNYGTSLHFLPIPEGLAHQYLLDQGLRRTIGTLPENCYNML